MNPEIASGAIDSMVCSADGQSIYFAAGSAIWSIPSSGGEVRKIRDGHSVVGDPSGRRLIVKSMGQSMGEAHLFSVPLNGDGEREIPLEGSIPLATSQLSTNALNADGRLLAPLAPRDSWFNPLGAIDTATGRVRRIPSNSLGDYRSVGWTRDGQVIALKNGLRATIWKFQPASH
jgi:hypothetical protein